MRCGSAFVWDKITVAYFSLVFRRAESLLENRSVSKVVPVDKRQVVGRNGKRELCEGFIQHRPFFAAKPDVHQVLESIYASDSVDTLPSPILPIRGASVVIDFPDDFGLSIRQGGHDVHNPHSFLVIALIRQRYAFSHRVRM